MVPWYITEYLALAVIFLHHLPTFLAPDCAAPVELAVAPRHHLHHVLPHSETALHAQCATAASLGLASLHRLRRPRTFPAFRSHCSRRWRLRSRRRRLAVVSRRHEVNEIFGRDHGQAPEPGLVSVTQLAVLEVHVHCARVATFEKVAHSPEVRKTSPARAQWAASGHTVALAA